MVVKILYNTSRWSCSLFSVYTRIFDESLSSTIGKMQTAFTQQSQMLIYLALAPDVASSSKGILTGGACLYLGPTF